MKGIFVKAIADTATVALTAGSTTAFAEVSRDLVGYVDSGGAHGNSRISSLFDGCRLYMRIPHNGNVGMKRRKVREKDLSGYTPLGIRALSGAA